ncbi:MAG: SpoVA/SpoVAEb family sporulation membrane protein [Lachnospiraceae bacterium]|nr:SpoVA/SpoVAEb family sporulation membrane protein [Lachnospiraceae bacterium]
MIHEVVKETDSAKRDQKYNQYVEQVTPKHNPWINIAWAFVIGGAICTLGQALTNLYMDWGVNKEDAALYVIITLIGLSALTTGLNFYQKLTKYAGAGSVVPITGFANSVAASAIEYSKEGQVFGIGCKIFTIAGPVILYGIITSWALGLGYWILKLMGVF